MPKIRVLVVDDSVVIRKMLTEDLSSDSDVEVVGSAADGRIALQKVPQVNPDLVVLDVEMPELDGLETLRLLKADYPRLPVIMFSSTTERGASNTLDALARGASDYVTKPQTSSGSDGRERVKQELLGKIKALRTVPGSAGAASVVAPALSPRLGPSKISALVIGVSTGGPNALAEILPQFPSNLPVPVLIVQHMPAMFTRLLAERLAAQSAVPVVEASGGMDVLPGRVYIAPGEYHMEVKRCGSTVLTHLHQGPPENSCRPAVDVLFRSAAAVYGSNLLAVVLTGMGQDGLIGCRHIKEAGGWVLAQDRVSSVVWGMPMFVTEAGLADAVVPLGDMTGEILRRVSGTI